jgi:hypothetical protein
MKQPQLPEKLYARNYAQIATVIYPLTRKRKRSELPGALLQLQDHWQDRLLSLSRCIEIPDMEYARNCPWVIATNPAATRTCNNRICPFCYARKIGRRYTRLLRTLQAQRDVKIIAWRAEVVEEEPISEAAFYMRGDALQVEYEPILARQEDLRKRLLERLQNVKKAKAAIYDFRLAPEYGQPAQEIIIEGFDDDPFDENGNYKEWDERPIEYIPATHGRWRHRHGSVAIMPRDYQRPSDQVREYPADARGLSRAFGYAFQYPRPWLIDPKARHLEPGAYPFLLRAAICATYDVKTVAHFGLISHRSNKVVKGDQHYNHKLTRVQAVDILRAYEHAKAEGKTWGFQTRMSKQYNTAVSTINNVVQRRSWKEITADEIGVPA